MRILALTFILLYSSPAVVRFVAVGDYLVRQEYYAMELCVNKDKPMSTCNGKCQIEGVIEQEKGSEQNLVLPPLGVKYSEIEAILNVERISNFHPRVLKISFKPHFDDFLKLDFINLVFVPPELFVKTSSKCKPRLS